MGFQQQSNNRGCKIKKKRSGRMSQASSSAVGVFCDCGLRTRISVSSTQANPKRKYRNCPNFGRGEYCSFFEWIDEDPIVRRVDDLENARDRLRATMEGMQNELGRLRDTMEDMQKRERFMLYFVVASLVVMVLLWK